MNQRHIDGSAGDADYGAIGGTYSTFRRPEPAILRVIEEALGDAELVLNVGAGTGSYEPVGRSVTAVEPSATMRAQRPAGRPAIDATAEALPFPDAHFDAAMATFTVHQWGDLQKGLAEMRRVTKGPVVILSCEPGEVQSFWLNGYAPEVLAVEARRYPSGRMMRKALAGSAFDMRPVAIPLNCVDGFNEAYYGRPEMFLMPEALQACSAWSFVSQEAAAAGVDALGADLASGRWDERHGHLRIQPAYEGSLYLYVSRA